VTTPSNFQATGISVQVWKPSIDTVVPLYTPRGSVVSASLEDRIDSYGHEILADGGWWSASITMSLPVQETEDWFENGLNRHVEVYNPSFVLVWAGFVNQVTISAGTLTAVRGPLLDVTNRVVVVYTPILDATTAPPLEGSETVTALTTDATSRAAFGILEDVVSGGKLLDDGTTDDATQLRDVYIAENKDPQTSEDLDFSSGGTATVQLDLLGYVHRFSKWIYEDVTAATVQIDTKIGLVITADPNGMFSTDLSQIGTNAALTSRYENDNRMAWDVLGEEVSLGDVANNRYTLGVYSGQRVTYAATPTTATYQHDILDQSMRVETYGDAATVDPWDVLPARWMFLYSFLPGRGQPAALRSDPRFLFIESVRFSSPNAVQVSGQKFSRIPQMLARLSR